MPYTALQKKVNTMFCYPDLGSMLSPNKYKIIFYASATEKVHQKLILLDGLVFPSLEFSVSTSPSTMR